MIKHDTTDDILGYTFKIESRDIFNDHKSYLLKCNSLRDALAGILNIKNKKDIEITCFTKIHSGLKITFKMYHNTSEYHALSDDDIKFSKTCTKLEQTIQIDWKLSERPKILNFIPLSNEEALNELKRQNVGSILTRNIKNTTQLDSINVQSHKQAITTINEDQESPNPQPIENDNNNLVIPKQDSGYDHARYSEYEREAQKLRAQAALSVASDNENIRNSAYSYYD